MSDLPESWRSTPITDIGEWVGGGTPSKSNDDYWGGPIPWISPKDMKVDVIRKTIDGITDEAVSNSAAKLIPPGSVVVVTRSGILAHTLPVATTAVDATLNQDLKALIPHSGVLPEFVAWALRGNQRDILNTCSKDGTTVHSIEMPSLSSYLLPLPPTNEQRRIVAKIEELFSELDKGVESLKLARAQLKLYRQSVLKHAFEGKLTADWREANPDKLEDPETLLARIQAERDSKYEQQLGEWNRAVSAWQANGEEGRKPSRPKRPKDLNTNLSDIQIDLPALPKGWLWQRLGFATCSPEYGTSAKSAETGSVPVIRMGNLQMGMIDWGDLVYTSDEDEIEKYRLRPDDVLFNRTNSPELVGKTAIYRGEREALFAGYLIRLNHVETAVSAQYATYYLNSHIAQQHGNTVKTDGVNQSNINGNKLQDYPFPYCSLDEQEAVVSRLDQLLSNTFAALAEIDAQLSKAEALRQSILKKAFSGELVPQDPADEPATVLLERIKADKATTKKPRRTRAVA